MSRILQNFRVRGRRLGSLARSVSTGQSPAANVPKPTRSNLLQAPVVIEIDDTGTLASSLGGDYDAAPPAYDQVITEKEPALKSAFATFKIFCRRAYRKLGLKHLISILMIVLYTVFGAALFLLMERSNDLHTRNETYHGYVEDRKQFVQNLTNFIINISRSRLLEADIIRHNISEELAKYEAILKVYEDIVGDDNFPGDVEKYKETHWLFSHAMYFAGTVYTTIGYGDIYCVTTAGRLFTILYSLIGIPVVLSVLTDLGGLLLKGLFNLTCFYNKCKSYIIPQSPDLVPSEDSDANTGMKKKKKPKPADPNETVGEFEDDDDETLDVEEEERREDDEYEYQLMRVPVLTALTATVGWIFVCAGLFCIWEDWTYFTAVYFFFISLSTVGLGDVTPERKDIMVATYALVIVGLALVSMCITVIQRRLEDLYLQLLRMILKEYHKQLQKGQDQMGATMGIMNFWQQNKAAKFLLPLLGKDKKANVAQKFQDEAKAKGFAVPAILKDLDPRTGVPAVLKVSKDKNHDKQSNLRDAVGDAIRKAAVKARSRHEPDEDAALETMYSLQTEPIPMEPPMQFEPPVPTPPSPAPTPPSPIAYDADTQTENLHTEDKQEQTVIVSKSDAETQSLETQLREYPRVDEAVQTPVITLIDACVQYELSITRDAGIQHESTVDSKDASVQHQSIIDSKDQWTQFEPMSESKDAFVQYEFTQPIRTDSSSQTPVINTKNALVQYDIIEEHAQHTVTRDDSAQTVLIDLIDADAQTQKIGCKEQLIQTHVYDVVDTEMQTDYVHTKNERIQTPIPETLDGESQTEHLFDANQASSSSQWGKAKTGLQDIIKKAMAGMHKSPSKQKLNSSPSCMNLDQQEPAMATWVDIGAENKYSSDEEESDSLSLQEPTPEGRERRPGASKRVRGNMLWDPVDGLHAEKQRRVSDLKNMFEAQKSLQKKK